MIRLVLNEIICNRQFTRRLSHIIKEIVKQEQKMSKTGLSPLDPSSYSRPDEAVVKDISLTLSVDFSKRIFSGNARLTIDKVKSDIKEIILDAKDLNISEITDTELNKSLEFSLAQPIDTFGSKLTISLPDKDSKRYSLLIKYCTSPNATGLQWFKPEQTLGKQHPYVFSQFQSIHARSFIPCQDTPAVKTKYSAQISAPSELTVLMSAERNGVKNLSDGKSTFSFVQNVPVPSYLMAIAIGALEGKKIGPRSHVWSEKELIEAAASEFEDTEAQLKAAEEICGPYLWGIYDLLVLPPSFPYGGMENPCLTFVTPTLLAGDKSLANVIAHEIAHSWTGNLVTNRNFEHFWLNEGFTVFTERKIIGRLAGEKERDFQSYCGTTELKAEIDRLGADNPNTCLITDLKGKDPDEAYCIVPYEKGQTFLRYLEKIVGGAAKFEPFLKDYFSQYQYKSIDSSVFKNYFTKYFASLPAINIIDWDKWLLSPGMPPVIPEYDMTLFEFCNEFIERFFSWNETIENAPFTLEEFKKFSTSQAIQIFQEMLDSDPPTIQKLKISESILKLDSVKNTEIRSRWIRICLRAHWESKIEDALNFVNEYGRMKYVRPVYRDLYAWELARPRAIENFLKNEGFYMAVAAKGLRKDLHL